MESNFWIETRTGKRFSLNKPDPAAVDVREVAIALGNLCRFTGHTKRFYSVAQHSVICSLAVEWMLLNIGRGVAFGTLRTLKLAALLHDAHEAYVGDCSAPMKAAIEHRARSVTDPGFKPFNPYADIYNGVRAAVRVGLQLPRPGATVEARDLETNKIVALDVWQFVHEIDMAILWREKFDFMGEMDWPETPRPDFIPPPKLVGWVPEVAAHRFLLQYKDLTAPHSRLRRFKPRENWYDNIFKEYCALGRGRLTRALIERICPGDMTA